MRSLELRIPPPLVALLVAGAMWAVAAVAPLLDMPAFPRHAAAAAIALAGLVCSLAGIVSFRRAHTTVNPMKPQTSSSLVVSGIYRVTRNPMYLGLGCVLAAWTVLLSSAWALLGPVAFVLYMNRFQIGPEEKALSTLFGADYAAYRARVRRWL